MVTLRLPPVTLLFLYGFARGTLTEDPRACTTLFTQGVLGMGYGDSGNPFPNTLLWRLPKRYIIRGVDLLGRGCIFGGKVNMVVHDQHSEFAEERPLERFGEEIRDHVLCGTVSDFHPPSLDLINDI